ncbi:MAG: tetratricopeptide repeat protein [Myxococcales bacterium]|nr:tetratricopeptide repeat protein [Myxococcales bacterium]
MRAASVVLIALAVVGASPTARAKPDSGGSSDDARARELYKKGDAAYAEGRYEDALTAFQEAYRLSQRSPLLFNIGNALERLGKLADAADALEKYLPHAKPAEKDVISKRVENLRKRAEEQAKKKPKAPVVEDEPDEPEPKKHRRKRAAEPEDSEPEKPKAASPTRDQANPSADSGGSTLGYVLVGAGSVAIGTGAVFGLMALSARKDADAACKQSGGQTLCGESARSALDRDKRYSLIADLGMGIGLVSAGVGFYLLVSEPSSESKTAARSRFVADVEASPSGGMLRVRGRL